MYVQYSYIKRDLKIEHHLAQFVYYGECFSNPPSVQLK